MTTTTQTTVESRRHPGWLWLTAPIVALMAVASAAGVFVDSVYAKESASWAAQGVGQDIVNLILVCPALAVSAYGAGKGSLRAELVWMGLLIYVVYSYVLYALFVHFNALFLPHVAVLGLSGYALCGALATVDRERFDDSFDRGQRPKAASIYLMISGASFGLLWLADIVGATVSGAAPAMVAELGMPVNPIHVRDLAFVLPGMILMSRLLWKRRLTGFLLAVPLMRFAAVMGTAIVAMSRVMAARGLPGLGGMEIVMAMMVMISLALTYRFLAQMSDP